jgi:adenine-specific DNA-methyltransferase
MNKPKFETTNLTAENVTKIAEIFPGVVTEGKVNFDLLRSLLGDEVYGDEAYEFTWVGKRAAIAEAGRPIRKTLRPCPEESKNWDTTENLYIEGDNLDVLKLLQESYLGKVKMIYIDPPYNTGNDFIYRDNFTRDKDEYDQEAGVYDEDGDRLLRNTESNGRFHSDWCSMMYPRLVLARNLLRDDGACFISIDDHEIENLKKLCNETFGEGNFVAQIVWQKKYAVSNDDPGIASMHDYILVYRKSINYKRNLLPRTEKQLQRYNNLDNDPRGDWSSDNYISNKSRWERPTLWYPIIHPKTGAEVWPDENAVWRYAKDKHEQMVRENRLYWGPDMSYERPRIKRF